MIKILIILWFAPFLVFSQTDTLQVSIKNLDSTGKATISSTIVNTVNGKQSTLVSGTNIKTINGSSVLGSGDITVNGSIDSTIVATLYRVDSMRNNLWAAIAGKYNSTNPSGYITSSSLSAYKQIADSGRAATNYVTGYLLNKIRDSVQSNIPTNNNQLTNGSNFITASSLSPYKLIADSGRTASSYITGGSLNKVRDSVQSNIPTNTNQLTNGAGFITSSSLSPYKQITDSGRVSTNYATGGSLNKVRDSLQGIIPTNTNQLTNGAAFITAASLSPYKTITDSGRVATNYATGGSLNKVRDSVAALYPRQVAIADIAATSGATSTTTLFTPTADGMYRVSIYMKITTTGNSPVAGPVTITYTDADGSVAQSHVMLLQNTSGAVVTTTVNNSTTTGTVNGTMIVNAKSGVAIQYAIAVSGTFGSGRYTAHLTCERIK